MANNQPPAGGNNMAALLGNMRPALQNPALANYGGGLQPPMQGGFGGFGPAQGQVYRGPLDASGRPMQAPGTYEQVGGSTFGGQANPITRYTPPGGWGAAGGAANPLAGAQPMPRPPMPSLGAPGGGAAGKGQGMKQQIAQLPGGPPMKQRLGGAFGNMLRRPGMPMNPPQGR